MGRINVTYRIFEELHRSNNTLLPSSPPLLAVLVLLLAFAALLLLCCPFAAPLLLLLLLLPLGCAPAAPLLAAPLPEKLPCSKGRFFANRKNRKKVVCLKIFFDPLF